MQEFTCSTCNFKWLAGQSGSHSCSKNLKVQLEKANKIIQQLTEDVPEGSKYRCIGEFFVEVEMECPECSNSLDEHDDECEICLGEVEYTQKHVIPWTTIKDIYKLMKPKKQGS
jgi:hypothetical protein